MQISFAGDLFGRDPTSALQRRFAWLDQRGGQLHFAAHSMVALIAR
jgi:hypothetical protein